ncbi:MAG: SpoIIE family protein phosphatase [Endozoicomonadaceae bacterium]|nr:SpoIIE family protein phosphatase [Endozoicomonadaceae bacterium]MCY4329353.1 SpoIIE family protein phosphatase [Endozoicomonadaceae bacterium]
MDVLVVDDAKDQQMILSCVLKKQGHTVHIAGDGKQALKLLNSNSAIQLVISDWMMPEMDGPELCTHIRKQNFSRYIYFLMLTGKIEDDAVIRGMEVGADDFLRKPVNFRELEVRMKAGIRVLELEQDLAERNKALKSALNTIESDLKLAGEALQNLLPAADTRLQNTYFDWRFYPCKILGGDMLGYQALDSEHLAFYQIDVSGHGIPAALFSFSLNHFLSDINPRSSLLIKDSADQNAEQDSAEPFATIQSPENVLAQLNERFQNSVESMTYFTMVYGVLHTPTGAVKIAHAGHPPVLKISKTGEVSAVQGVGAPVGMVPQFPYVCESITLQTGEALFCYTDGLTENMNQQDEEFGEERLKQLLKKQAKATVHHLMDEIVDAAIHWKGDSRFVDDVSYLLLKR